MSDVTNMWTNMDVVFQWYYYAAKLQQLDMFGPGEKLKYLHTN